MHSMLIVVERYSIVSSELVLTLATSQLFDQATLMPSVGLPYHLQLDHLGAYDPATLVFIVEQLWCLRPTTLVLTIRP